MDIGDIVKIIKLLPAIAIFALVGCGNKNYITCDVNINNEVENYNVTGTYKIYYDGNYVSKIEKQENYSIKDENTKDYLYEFKSLEYFDLSDKYGGLEYKITKTNDGIKIKSSTNLNEVDLINMSKDNKIDKDYVVGGKLTLNGLKRIYKSKGAICEEE